MVLQATIAKYGCSNHAFAMDINATINCRRLISSSGFTALEKHGHNLSNDNNIAVPRDEREYRVIVV